MCFSKQKPNLKNTAGKPVSLRKSSHFAGSADSPLEMECVPVNSPEFVQESSVGLCCTTFVLTVSTDSPGESLRQAELMFTTGCVLTESEARKGKL